MDSIFNLRISVWGEKLENLPRVCKPSEAKYVFSNSRSSWKMSLYHNVQTNNMFMEIHVFVTYMYLPNYKAYLCKWLNNVSSASLAVYCWTLTHRKTLRVYHTPIPLTPPPCKDRRTTQTKMRSQQKWSWTSSTVWKISQSKLWASR